VSSIINSDSRRLYAASQVAVRKNMYLFLKKTRNIFWIRRMQDIRSAHSSNEAPWDGFKTNNFSAHCRSCSAYILCPVSTFVLHG
jgi:hypothetical protein